MDYNPGGYYSPPPEDNGYTPQGRKMPPFVSTDRWMRERSSLRRLGMMAGCGILLYILLSSVYVFIFQGVGYIIKNTGIVDSAAYTAAVSSAEFEYIYELLYSVFAVGTPFFIIGIISRKKGRLTDLPTAKPKNAKYLPIIVIGAFGVCLLGNIVTSYLDLFFETVTGIELSMPETPDTPKTFLGIFLYFLSTAVVPALVEEMAMRGIIMQSLRSRGEWFAIFMSAMVFALMHCNLMQIPFAFIAGIVIGYAVIVTDSVWTGVLIHFCNNAFSVAVDLVDQYYGMESKAYAVCNVLFYTFIALGAVCAVFYVTKLNKTKLKKSPLVNTGSSFACPPPPFSASVSNGTLVKTYIVNVPMIAAFIAVAYETVLAVTML